jgi:AraC-like DNA-binding protein
MREETVASGFVLGLLDYAVSRGADRDALLESAGVDVSALLEERDNRLPYACYVALMQAAKAAIGDPALALNFGQAINVADISIVGLIGQASDTMLEAFEQLNRYVRLIVDIELIGEDRFVLKRDAFGLWLTDMRANPNAFPELTESAFSHIIAGPRRAGIPQWITEVRVTHPRPAHAADYERVFQTPVRFDSDRNAMRMDERIVSHRVGLLPRYAFGVLTEHADSLLKQLEASETMRGRVEHQLLPVLHKGEASMEAVAEKIGVNRQALYRALKDEGVTFEQVLDELRHRLALEYLRGRKTSVNETAYLVGFSDPAAFSRAFKRWTGKSPREARGA